ncbi:MAG: type VI secretion system accessory protein TagJ [Pseudomonadota bacterium]
MTAEPSALLKAGDPEGALAALQDKVRADPADARLRIFLFQLLCVLGDWKRAVTQLKVAAEMDESATTMAQAYRETIICENFREKVFAGEKEPLIFGKPQEWIALLVEALKTLASGKTAEAAELRARAFEMAPATPGTLNDTAFEWIADADMRLGPILEVIVNGKYFWMPFSAIHSLRCEAPSDLRDYVWTPGNLTLQNGGEHVVMIPTRYAGTTSSNDGAEMLARATSWSDAGDDTYLGSGQRLLATEAGDMGLLELRTLSVQPLEEDMAEGDG